MKLTTHCLLAVLIGTAALAHTRPPQKPARKHTVVRQPIAKSTTAQSRKEWICVGPLLPPAINDAVAAELPDSGKVYTYVEQMPTLNGQPLAAASRAAIRQRLAVSPAAPVGRVFVGFEITKAGSVRNVQILKGLRADVDSAVATATRQLPRFTPGKQAGHVVVVRTVVFITLPVEKQP